MENNFTQNINDLNELNEDFINSLLKISISLSFILIYAMYKA